MHNFLILAMFASLMLLSTDTRAADWRVPSLEDTVYMHTEEGLVIIELATFMAPAHAQRFRQLIKEGFYDGLPFYRVIDGFVVQAGDAANTKKTEHRSPLEPEFTRATSEQSTFVSVQRPALLAPETGYLHGFSAGRDPESKQEWLLHCPGVVAMARATEANTATTDFYVVIGQAPRHLDRNMSVFGRVLYGMDTLQRIKRGKRDQGGVISEPSLQSKIEWAKLANDIPLTERFAIQVATGTAEQTQNRLQAARSLDNPFYVFKGDGNRPIDLCYYQTQVKVVAPTSVQPDA
ncbi:peptidylprolyl isomerase [Aestuariibacter salexigens]|uniref:peptidylprolyl isomerase n=1 Tax=Aestuariibacter salexigens TaxID=226010 RepID=UPI000417D381|nr:peptidylprolyl isomerase [Aestuariibacter salexigens]